MPSTISSTRCVRLTSWRRQALSLLPLAMQPGTGVPAPRYCESLATGKPAARRLASVAAAMLASRLEM